MERGKGEMSLETKGGMVRVCLLSEAFVGVAQRPLPHPTTCPNEDLQLLTETFAATVRIQPGQASFLIDSIASPHCRHRLLQRLSSASSRGSIAVGRCLLFLPLLLAPSSPTSVAPAECLPLLPFAVVTSAIRSVTLPATGARCRRYPLPQLLLAVLSIAAINPCSNDYNRRSQSLPSPSDTIFPATVASSLPPLATTAHLSSTAVVPCYSPHRLILSAVGSSSSEAPSPGSLFRHLNNGTH
ncbi:hypothetical protein B296_00003000 [Ensete ventricosum]|uniref:Uncharacterized protein n=1 Tax=Ensete ventricosum TaxID=4639 RepID=A0A427A698_ENSVE|nr:hypothetical protein B296_00003000 [Ensete ventricosum]